MFTLLTGNLGGEHALQSLAVHIHTPFEWHHSRSHELRDVRTGTFSRAHVAAFLTDPLRTVRGVENGRKRGTFTLDYVGRSAQAWRNIEGDVRKLVQSRFPVPNYELFRAYFASVFKICGINGVELDKHWSLPCIAQARIWGDVFGLHRVHRDFVAGIAAVCKNELQWHEETLREVVYLGRGLASRLPPLNADTSFYGYALANERLRQWRVYGRAEKKAERKRKREEKMKRQAEVVKKAKLSEAAGGAGQRGEGTHM